MVLIFNSYFQELFNFGTDLKVTEQELVDLALSLPDSLCVLQFDGCTECHLIRKVLYDREIFSGKKVQELLGTEPSWGVTLDLDAAQKTYAGDRLTQSQIYAIQKMLTHRIAIITGGPGVGKTTLLHGVVEILKASFVDRKQKPVLNFFRGISFKLGALTGRAAYRMRQQTEAPATTIHYAARAKQGETIATSLSHVTI